MQPLIFFSCVLLVMIMMCEVDNCDINYHREKLRAACGNYRRKRSSESKNHGYKNRNSLEYGHTRHTFSHQLLSNDSNGGAILLEKRGRKTWLKYCCLERNCSDYYKCS